MAARPRWLKPALQQALGKIDPTALASELAVYVPRDVRRVLAAAGIRDEYVFPTPVVLRAAPMLVGYYRLLLGRPQKSFYSASKDGFGMFKTMEERGLMGRKQEQALGDFCGAICSAMADMVRQISPAITEQDIAELPILTLGSQLQGGNNNTIGQQATNDVFTSILAIVDPTTIVDQSQTAVTFKNLPGRLVTLELAIDPDVGVRETIREGDEQVKRLAIEIKGGTDASNAHNRAGEAEKSHIKARRSGYAECWTVIATKGVDIAKLREESPSTHRFFDVSQILLREGPDWEDFAGRLRSVLGI